MLTQIAKDVWSQDEDLRLRGGMIMPARATIVRLPGGELVIHSPLPIDDQVAAELASLGEVRFLVAPNRLHWMFVKGAITRYPNARVIAAPGLERKLPDVALTPLPASGRIEGMGDDLRVQRIEGAPTMTEHALYHERSQSLIVTDLLFNVQRSKGFMAGLFLRLVGAHGKTAQSRVWRMVVADRVAAARSAAAVLSWDFERIVVAHGDVVSDAAHERARLALAWMTARAPERLLGAST